MDAFPIEQPIRSLKKSVWNDLKGLFAREKLRQKGQNPLFDLMQNWLRSKVRNLTKF